MIKFNVHSFQKIVSKDEDLDFTSTLPVSDTELPEYKWMNVINREDWGFPD